MKNNAEPDFLNQLDTVFAHLNPQAVEEFYAAYHQWCVRQRIAELRHRIDAVREQQAHNQQRLQETRPTTVALAALARLQSNGVSDIALLDAMLERGESWLDRTMQRLDYFEQFDDFISDDYTKWCQGALEGAFDWIDSLLESTEQTASAQLETPPTEEQPDNEDAGNVEVLLLQRLATEDEQDDLSWQEAITLKQTTIKAPPPETVTSEAEEQEPPALVSTGAGEQEPPAPENTARQDVETQAHIPEYIPQDEPAHSDETPIASSNVASSTSPEEQFIPEEVLPVEDTPISASEQPALVEFAAPSELSPAEESSERVVEQSAPTEITMPEDTPTADTAQSEVNEPDEMENSASEDAHQQQVIPTSKPVPSTRNTPRKRGLIGTLIWILTGK